MLQNPDFNNTLTNIVRTYIGSNVSHTAMKSSLFSHNYAVRPHLQTLRSENNRLGLFYTPAAGINPELLISRGAATEQSSTGRQGYSSYAVDGNRGGMYFK